MRYRANGGDLTQVRGTLERFQEGMPVFHWETLGTATFPPPDSSDIVVETFERAQQLVPIDDVYVLMQAKSNGLQPSVVASWGASLGDQSGAGAQTVVQMLMGEYMSETNGSPISRRLWREARNVAFTSLRQWIDATATEMRLSDAPLSSSQQLTGTNLLAALRRADFGFRGGNVKKFDTEYAATVSKRDPVERCIAKAGSYNGSKQSGQGRFFPDRKGAPHGPPKCDKCHATLEDGQSFRDHNKICPKRLGGSQ